MPRNTAHGYSEHSVQETKLLYSTLWKAIVQPRLDLIVLNFGRPIKLTKLKNWKV